jgi:hypothetical protein
VEPAATYAAPHGVAIIDQINHALGQPKDVGVLKNSYYETPELFESKEVIDSTEDEKLLSKTLIILEPHPNNAEERNVHPHNPYKLIEMLIKNEMNHTVIMDVTLNHLGEKEIGDILNMARPIIDKGKLNLIFLQSGTKFLQHGMDIVGMGTSIVFNNREGQWKKFNERMEATRQSVPEDDAAYMANMMGSNKKELGEYLQRIRENTTFLKTVLLTQLNQTQPNAFEVTFSSDPQTFYVAIAPTEAFVQLYIKNIRVNLNPQTRSCPKPSKS